jgi:predicted lipoprotein with Yx(FWY)xxD motif
MDTMRRHTDPRRYAGLLVLAAAVLALSACGGGGESTGSAAAPDDSDATETVSTSTVDGVGDVLVDSEGVALYSADQETSRNVICTGSCTSFWLPLTVPAGETPTASADISAQIGIVERPDGARQVTFDEKPLYRFVEDQGPGVVSGNGFSDSFDGKDFTWHVASATGADAPSPSGGGTDYGS